MVSLPQFNEGELDLLVAYSPDPEEEMVEAIVNAFLAANVDVFDKPTTLVDWINTDAIEDLKWSSAHPLYLSTEIWDHQVVVTAEEIRIYKQVLLVRSSGKVQSVGR